ncbi:beta-eliminating lyase [Microdochium trichocladiopsis]|uniref:Beta-eliminating lyase n=1 Tax=Microdochium trichocladiopsis TaxID=1682393 RepID=A0A9P8YL31_9PEZI|nr:beta-eliminating lyase [Microdochium trichocladiopsis]KAH7040974.1 beta-eliminating lyase [Microdochium trichocladiopsis]
MARTTDYSSIAWGNPEKTGAAFDFRSDVVTTPSRATLAAIACATLNDDVYNEDTTTAEFENDMAARCGHEAAAFVITGTMANQLALRSLLYQPPHSILTDAHSHIIHWEAGAASFLSGAAIQAVRPVNGRHLTLDDIRKHAIWTDDVHKCPTRVISLENTTSGNIIPLSDMRMIKAWADDRGILVHLDGARLWEAVGTGAGTLRDFAQCAHLTTLDFSKNLAAPMGAMVVGSRRAITALKRIRKGLGGGMRQAGILAAAARQSVFEHFGGGIVCTQPHLIKSHLMAQRVAQAWTNRGGRLLRDAETNMVWLDLNASAVDINSWNSIGKKHGIMLNGKRVVTHHQLCEAAFSLLDVVMDEALDLVRYGSNEERVRKTKL